jgi:hypothetical protein
LAVGSSRRRTFVRRASREARATLRIPPESLNHSFSEVRGQADHFEGFGDPFSETVRGPPGPKAVGHVLEDRAPEEVRFLEEEGHFSAEFPFPFFR